MSLTPIPVPAWQDIDGIAHGFFTRQGGVSQGIYASLNAALSSDDDPSSAHENRRRIAHHLGTAPENLLSCYQCHSSDVVTVTDIWKPEDRPRADAMVTALPQIALGILTADCCPVLFVDPVHKVIGAAHAGWRGAFGNIMGATITAMEKLGASRSAISAALGPCIWQTSYEVDDDFKNNFLQKYPNATRFFVPASRAGHANFDLPSFVTFILRQEGLKSIVASPADTFVDPARFFSYRYNTLRLGVKKAPSLLSGIMLKGE